VDTNRLASLRREYVRIGLHEADLAADPLTQFGTWLAEAVAAGLREPNAMVVASANARAVPSARLVLLKGYDERGFVFYTNYGSRKAAELEENPRAALLFPWHDLERQVRVEGPVSRVERDQSEAYFASRPRGAQLGAWASRQSRELGGRAELEAAFTETVGRFDAREVPLPSFWGGYRVAPEVVEFWQGRSDRLHDRLVYRRDGMGWSVHRLAP
jgi:pyridoxamine 5'-phosphate oxidase